MHFGHIFRSPRTQDYLISKDCGPRILWILRCPIVIGGVFGLDGDPNSPGNLGRMEMAADEIEIGHASSFEIPFTPFKNRSISSSVL